MLVLTRKVGEGIRIGDEIKVVVMQVKGKQVRIGIEAGEQTAVHREEIYNRIKDENTDAARSKGEGIDRTSHFFNKNEDSPESKRRTIRYVVNNKKD